MFWRQNLQTIKAPFDIRDETRHFLTFCGCACAMAAIFRADARAFQLFNFRSHGTTTIKKMTYASIFKIGNVSLIVHFGLKDTLNGVIKMEETVFAAEIVIIIVYAYLPGDSLIFPPKICMCRARAKIEVMKDVTERESKKGDPVLAQPRFSSQIILTFELSAFAKLHGFVVSILTLAVIPNVTFEM